VRAGTLDAAAVPAVGARARVRADDQDVFRAVQLRRPVAQLAGRDVQVVDAVVYAAVGGVGAERDEGDRQRGEDAGDAEHRVAAEDAAEPGGTLAHPRWVPVGRLPGFPATTRTAAGVPVTGVVGVAAAKPRSAAPFFPGGVLASAFRILVAAHCCCSA